MKPLEKGFLTIALALSVSALAVSIRQSSRPDPRFSVDDRPLRDRNPSDPRQSPKSEGGSAADLGPLERRLDRLEKRISQLEAPRAGNGGAHAPTEDEQKEINALVAVAVDPAAHEVTRLGVLKQLRKRAPASRSGAVTLAMIDLLRRSEDEVFRADVVRNLYGVTDKELKEELLRRLGSDLGDGVRREAAETLELMLDDPAVKTALEWARDHDADEGVRKQAAESLARAPR